MEFSTEINHLVDLNSSGVKQVPARIVNKTITTGASKATVNSQLDVKDEIKLEIDEIVSSESADGDTTMIPNSDMKYMDGDVLNMLSIEIEEDNIGEVQLCRYVIRDKSSDAITARKQEAGNENDVISKKCVEVSEQQPESLTKSAKFNNKQLDSANPKQPISSASGSTTWFSNEYNSKLNLYCRDTNNDSQGNESSWWQSDAELSSYIETKLKTASDEMNHNKVSGSQNYGEINNILNFSDQSKIFDAKIVKDSDSGINDKRNDINYKDIGFISFKLKKPRQKSSAQKDAETPNGNEANHVLQLESSVKNNSKVEDSISNSCETKTKPFEHKITTKKTKITPVNKDTSASLELTDNFPKGKLHICTVCSMLFTRKSSLNKHLRTHNPTREKAFKCNICNKSISCLTYLKAHQESHNKPWKCDICGKNFAFKSYLGIHMRHHLDERPYVCDICGKSFTAATCLTKHRRIHTGISPYQCLICGKMFAQKVCLYLHASSHSGIKPFLCEICGKGFALNAHLSKHVRTAHPSADTVEPPVRRRLRTIRKISSSDETLPASTVFE